MDSGKFLKYVTVNFQLKIISHESEHTSSFKKILSEFRKQGVICLKLC